MPGKVSQGFQIKTFTRAIRLLKMLITFRRLTVISALFLQFDGACVPRSNPITTIIHTIIRSFFAPVSHVCAVSSSSSTQSSVYLSSSPDLVICRSQVPPVHEIYRRSHPSCSHMKCLFLLACRWLFDEQPLQSTLVPLSSRTKSFFHWPLCTIKPRRPIPIAAPH